MRTEKDLYDALEAVLKKKKHPMTAVQLFKLGEVQKFAASATRVSDYLGNMWRRGVLLRRPAPKLDDDNSRWMYSWKGRAAATVPPDSAAVEHRPTEILVTKWGLDITKNGDVVTISTKELTIVIRPKQSRGEGLPD